MRAAVEGISHALPQDALYEMRRKEIEQLEDEIHDTISELASKDGTSNDKNTKSRDIENNTSMTTTQNEQINSADDLQVTTTAGDRIDVYWRLEEYLFPVTVEPTN